MAQRLALPNNREMPFIWNVSAHVGDAPSCANNPTDVRLVKILIGEWIRRIQPSIHPSCREHFEMSAGMNLRTAYWIRVVNQTHQMLDNGQRLNFAQQGVISPARGSGYGGDTWSIYRLNYSLKQANQQVWQNIPNHPNCGPDLARELA